jgi:hypothetical protein
MPLLFLVSYCCNAEKKSTGMLDRCGGARPFIVKKKLVEKIKKKHCNRAMIFSGG